MNYCSYFKPGKNEDLACQGFIVVHSILRSGKRIPQERPDRIAIPPRRTLEGLKQRVCALCSFHDSDCDYIATSGASASCGGFALLAHLLGSGELTLGEIDEAL
ncbi:MAG: hypothetical protein OEW15_13515 [Nitrospirota bacterium]|nr:hypothetical protein [Nitrospirota bacterium]